MKAGEARFEGDAGAFLQRDPECLVQVYAAGFRVQGSGFRDEGSGFRVQG